MINIATVPEWLENSVSETEHQNILNRLFSQVVIDAVHLLLPEHLQDLLVERLHAFQVVSKRLLDNDSGPAAGAVQANRSQQLSEGSVETGRRGEVKKAITGSSTLLIDPGNQRTESLEALLILHIGGSVKHAGCAILPDPAIDLILVDILMDGLLHSGTKVLTTHGGAGRSHNGKTAGQKTLLSQIVECWNQLALG